MALWGTILIWYFWKHFEWHHNFLIRSLQTVLSHKISRKKVKMKTVSFITLRKLLTFASHVANSQLPYVWRYLHASVPLSTKHSNSTPSKIWRLTRHHCTCNWTSGIDQFFQNLIMAETCLTLTKWYESNIHGSCLVNLLSTFNKCLLDKITEIPPLYSATTYNRFEDNMNTSRQWKSSLN